MRFVRRLLGILCIGSMLFSFTLPVFAAQEQYTYTVRIYAGIQGLIDGETMVEYTGLHYGDRVSFQQNRVQIHEDGKYYVKGIRRSGRDNNTAQANASFVVTQDMDYVVAYGVLGSAVSYTVSYVDEAGNELAASETYYGNVGDRPVVAYLYIDGYQPQAYNLTGTLKEESTDNRFTFRYAPTTQQGEIVVEQPAQEEIGEEQNENGAMPDNTTPDNTTPGTVAGTENRTETQTPVENENENENAAQVVEGNIETDDSVQEEGPAELLDIDEPEVPLVNATDSVSSDASTAIQKRKVMLPVAAVLGIVSGIALVAVWGVWILLQRKKKGKES